MIPGELIAMSLFRCKTQVCKREEVAPLILGVSGNRQEGYNSRLKAERAYALSYAIGAVHTVNPRGAPTAPMPPALMNAFEETDGDYLGADWHVVFKGRTPGMYPAWYAS
jgi:hypothetical protein